MEAKVETVDLTIGKEELEAIFRLKHGEPETVGWRPRLSYYYGYFTPDEYYEALVAKLVQEGQAWLDVGGGRDLFPHNRSLAELLSKRSGWVVGVDPDDTLDENAYIHYKIKSSIEEYCEERTFPLVTLRMVAEHIAQPQRAAAALSRLTAPGGRVVIYTINRWSPLSWLARFIPFRFHHAIKHYFWGTEEKDTFPVVYKMNSRRRLAQIFNAAGFRECSFEYLSDCRTFGRFRSLFCLELFIWRALKLLGLHYPENCLLGVYERI